MGEDRTKIRAFEVQWPQIYAYIHPKEPDDSGWIKIGDTTRYDVRERVAEQNKTASKHFSFEILWSEPACYRESKKFFRDHDFHKYLTRVKNVERRRWEDGKLSEWFYYNGNPEHSHLHFNEFVGGEYSQAQGETEYVLRSEQQEAVYATTQYFKANNGGKFLWNAKPRFGKTLTTYDLALGMNAKNVLIVTNRPAIANSWLDDFEKFIAWKVPKTAFVSEASALKNRNALSFKKFEKLRAKGQYDGMFAFISLQDLKGAAAFGGKHDKLGWVKETSWDLLVIDESHEGVDTLKTDIAFEEITATSRLYLSGTPFKQLASGDFNEEQIFNWTYVDEQTAKSEWDTSSEENNPYEELPTINMFTYQISEMLAQTIGKGACLGESKTEYAFDLFEFFKTNE